MKWQSEYFRFNNDDLKFNHCGQISQRQILWLRKFQPRLRSFLWMVATLLLMLSLTLVFYLMNKADFSLWLLNPTNRIALLITISDVIGLFGMSTFVARRNAGGLDNPIFLLIEGDLQADWEKNSYYVSIGEKNFVFHDDISKIFLMNKRYEMYLCESGVYTFLLAFEKLGD